MSTVDGPKRDTVRIEGPAPRILLIQAPYYDQVVGGMRRGVERVVAEAGGVLEVVDVAGAFELPAALRMALDAMEHPEEPPLWDGFVLLGCVVKGDTDHYDHICREACSGVMSVAVGTGAAIGFGLLTVHTLQQAIERSSDDGHNKGAEAAQAALLQVALRRKWRMA
ncbi:6,7-dimethyl-8-ribityllumazine synthase [Roseococcus sp. SYP-B2431]|uniref:6,7-dimethyl-8-ribityllumazine synthase n=1 Tax=Roseococcus sp. SYP-B2431 TaxID=2496640 RepID=UPI00103FA12B|nr:6,7-dimethyl-8-ribityllumazine synthase [Roseococcus sp. SYP-B2431]TCH96563.1 6,7-dimethyl-8-ribityllumazine synthase [Roseococcus sp. SYP-B2431]